MGSLLREATFLGAAVTNSRSVLEDVDVETNLLLGAVRAEESAVGDSDLELSALEFFVQIVLVICHHLVVVLHHHLVALLFMHQNGNCIIEAHCTQKKKNFTWLDQV